MPDDANARLTPALAGRSRIERRLGEGGRTPVHRAGDVRCTGIVPLTRDVKPPVVVLGLFGGPADTRRRP